MKRKGFTLIELLAVIVILAVISLVAIPVILGIIEKTNLKSAEVSATGYVGAVENYMAMHEIDPMTYPYDLKVDETYQVSNSGESTDNPYPK